MQEHKLLSCLQKSCYGRGLSNLSTGADSLLETVGWKEPYLSLPAKRVPLDLCLSPSFLLLLYPNQWRTGEQELERAVLIKEAHTALGLSCPNDNSECEDRDWRLYTECGDTHREAWSILVGALRPAASYLRTVAGPSRQK